MCGIIGGNLFTNRAQVENAQELISHRGKDASCAYSYDGVWMGHNRLSIQDLDSKANQPMVDETPFPTHKYWDKKAWRWLTENIDEIEGKTLFWNLGS